MRVVNQLDMEVEKGTVAAILGANGAGKSSLIMALAGHIDVKEGMVEYEDQNITFCSPMERVKKGIAIVPEGRRLFKNLSVHENLIVGGYTTSKKISQENIEKVLSVFPRLGERFKLKAGSLPIPVKIVENQIIGPTLGSDSIIKSKLAVIITNSKTPCLT